MKDPKIAGYAPLSVDLKAGKKYAWCSCGESSIQPLCDGSHRDTEFNPVKWVAEEDKTVWLCTCKQTDNPGFCDGSHNQLKKD